MSEKILNTDYFWNKNEKSEMEAEQVWKLEADDFQLPIGFSIFLVSIFTFVKKPKAGSWKFWFQPFLVKTGKLKVGS